MKRKIKAFLLFSVLTLGCSAQSIPYKRVKLHNNEISLSVPSDWESNSDGLIFPDYQVKYSIAVQSKRDRSGVSLYVYKQQYGPKTQITDSIVQNNIQGMLSDPVKKIVIEKSGLKTVSGMTVGFVKYTYRVKRRKLFSRSYAIELFFCNRNNVYNRVDIIGFKNSVSEFKPIAERIFESLTIGD